jgi:nitrogen regulatory protein P-II 1
MEVVVDDGDADDIVNVILGSAASTASGAGKIWITPVVSLTRVRTGERGMDAI